MYEEGVVRNIREEGMELRQERATLRKGEVEKGIMKRDAGGKGKNNS